MSLGFEEHSPGMDRTPRGWERIVADDEARSAELTRLCGIGLTPEERQARHDAERLDILAERAKVGANRQARSQAKLAGVSFWPTWAIPLGTALQGRCCTCGDFCASERRRSHVPAIRFCGGCQRRLGRHVPRVRLAIEAVR